MSPNTRVRHTNPASLPACDASRLKGRVGTVLRLYSAGCRLFAFVQFDRRRAGSPELFRSLAVADLAACDRE